MTRRAGVMGSPIAHSLSPAIFTAAFEAAGLDWEYRAYEVGEADAPGFLDEVRSGRIDGLSVTMPDKAAVIPALDHLSTIAGDLGAVNCVARIEHEVWGFNTDGDGLVDSLRIDEGIEVAGLACAVIGAGGAGRAVARALGAAGANVRIVNRTRERAEAAAALAGPKGWVADEETLVTAELVINTTSVGMGDFGGVPVVPGFINPTSIVVDIIYHPAVTPLLRVAAGKGCRTVGGLGMLVHQAGHAFRLWTGEAPPLDAMRVGAEAALAARERS